MTTKERLFESLAVASRPLQPNRLLFVVQRLENRRSLVAQSRLAYFLASGVTVTFTRWPSRSTTMSTGWPILAASSA
jgi:hypothetical protein